MIPGSKYLLTPISYYLLIRNIRGKLMQTILIIEDDKDLRNGLGYDLESEGYHMVLSESGLRALEIIKRSQVDLVLLDINLPDINGFKLCQEIKKSGDILVIFLTACDMDKDQMKGFDLGADDYITKPFHTTLLRKRIAAVLRRYSKFTNSKVYSDGYLVLDFHNMLVKKENDEYHLTPTECKLLRIFTTNAGNVLTRQLLLEKLWDNEGNFVDEHALTVNINRLRNKLEDNNHKYIKTVYGMGYLWAGERFE